MEESYSCTSVAALKPTATFPVPTSPLQLNYADVTVLRQGKTGTRREEKRTNIL